MCSSSIYCLCFLFTFFPFSFLSSFILARTNTTEYLKIFVDSYGTSTTTNSSSTPDDESIRSVLQNTSRDKEQEQQRLQSEISNNNIHSDSLECSEKVIENITQTSPGVTLNEKNLEFETALYNTTVDSLFSQNNRYDFYSTSTDNSWPYDLSRTGSSLEYPQSATNYYNTNNFRNHYTNTFYNQAQSTLTTMKGKLMTLTPFHDPLSPPSSASDSSSDGFYYNYGSNDNNSSSFINNHENNNFLPSSMSSYSNQYLDDFCEILKDENYSVEDSSHYTTLTNASTGAFDMYMHDHITRNFGHQHSTSSGDSRSPSDAFAAADDYDNGMQNFTQLTQLTTRSNGLYTSSPVTDGMISNYDSAHVLTSNR